MGASLSPCGLDRLKEVTSRRFPLRIRNKKREAYEEAKGVANYSGKDLIERDSTVVWAANKSFKMLKFNFKFPRARTFELFRARSRLYRSQILKVSTRWKALAEIYTMHSFAPLWNP